MDRKLLSSSELLATKPGTLGNRRVNSSTLSDRGGAKVILAADEPATRKRSEASSELLAPRGPRRRGRGRRLLAWGHRAAACDEAGDRYRGSSRRARRRSG